MKNQQNKIQITKYLLLIPLALIVYFIFNSEDKEREQKVKDLFLKYPPIEKARNDYRGVIKQYKIGSEYTTGLGMYIELSTGDMFTISGTSYNSKYKKGDLRDNLQVNDSIYYNHNTYELYIYRKGETLYFKLFDSL